MDITELKIHLDHFLENFDFRSRVDKDPVQFIHRYENPNDQEIAGIIASSLAYGKVENFLRIIDEILCLMDNTPFNFVLNFNPKKDSKRFSHLVYRFNTGEDIANLIYIIQNVYKKYSSFYNLFLGNYNPEDKNITQTLSKSINEIKSISSLPFHNNGSINYLFPSPSNGSACKRLNLFLRWMIRKNDGVDIGIWKDISPSKLVIPLDTHIARISSHIGLTHRKSPDWKMAEEITSNLKRLDPYDPIKYDFALCHLGISKACPKSIDESKCHECDIKKICQL